MLEAKTTTKPGIAAGAAQKTYDSARFDIPRLTREAKFLAEAIRANQVATEKWWQKMWRQVRSYRTLVSNWIINFRRAQAGREDYFPLYFIWTTLRTCNFSCSYCDDHRGRKYPDLDNTGVLTTDQAKRLFRVMRTRTPALYYAGGEPTLRNDLPELMVTARELGYFPQLINTNASILQKRLLNPGWKNFLSDIDILIVSLDSLRPSVLSDVYKTTMPEHVVRNLLALHELSKEYRFKLMINCVIMPGLIEDAHDVLDLANELGLFFCGVPQNVGPRAAGGLLADPEYQAFVAKLLKRHREGKKFAGSYRMNERLYTGAKVNCRNSLKPHIDFDGRLWWPCKAVVNREPVMIRVLDHPDIDSVWREANRQVSITGFHGPGPDQCGANCNWAQNYTTDAYDHGLHHPGSLFREIVEFLRR